MKVFMDFVKSKLAQRLCPLDEANLPLASSYYDDEDEEILGFSRAGCYIIPNSAERYERHHHAQQERGQNFCAEDLPDRKRAI